MNRPLAGALGAALLLCSCTGDDGAAEQAGDATPTTELSGALTAWFVDPGSTPARAALQAAVDAFAAAQPAVTIEVEFGPRASGRKRLTAAIAAGQAPDLAEASTAWTTALATQGFLVPAAPADGVEYVDALVEAGSIDGTSYGLPWYGQTQALIYRADVLSRAGVSAPATWEEVFSVGDTIMAEMPEIAPLQVAGNHIDLQAPLVWAAGGEIATQSAVGWSSGVDSAAGLEAFSHFESVWKKGWSPRDAVGWTPKDVRTAFAKGQSAMMIGRRTDLRDVLAANPGMAGKVGTALLPAGPSGNRDAAASGTHLVVLDGSPDQEAAAALARHLTTPENVVPFTEALGVLPGSHDAVEAAVGDDEVLAAFGEQLAEHSRTYPAAAWWPNVVAAEAFEAATQQLMQGRLTASETAAAVDAAIRRAIG